MKKLLILAAAVAGALGYRRWRVSRDDERLWTAATEVPDLR